MAIPNPNPNIFDGAPRDNKTYSSAMIEKKISEGGGGSSVVPDPAVADIGKVLGIVSDGSTGAEYEAVSIPTELPDPRTADIGKVVSVVSDGSGGAKYNVTLLPSPSPTIREITLTLGAYDVAEDYGEVNCSHTMSQIKSYFDAGDVLHIKDTNGYYYSVSEVYGSSRISFLGARFESGTIVMYLVSLGDGEYTKRELST